MTKALIRRISDLRLLPPHEQLENLQTEPEHSQWEGQTLLIILKSGFQIMGTVLKLSDTHVVTDYGTIKKDEIVFVRAMTAEEIRVRRGVGP